MTYCLITIQTEFDVLNDQLAIKGPLLVKASNFVYAVSVVKDSMFLICAFDGTECAVKTMTCILNVLLCSNLKGIIVTLDETGYIYCSYLGTDPSLFVTPSAQSRDVQYEVSNGKK